MFAVAEGDEAEAVVEGLFAEQLVGLVLRLAQRDVTEREVGAAPGVVVRAGSAKRRILRSAGNQIMYDWLFASSW